MTDGLARLPRAIDQAEALPVIELRKRRMLQSRITRDAGVSAFAVSH